MVPPWKNQRVLAIANEWRGAATLDGCRWSKAENQAGGPQAGEAGGFMVRCDRYPDRRGYMKPTRSDRGNGSRAPREKIASDLAHDLGVPVPPVILADRSDAGGQEERFVCVSLIVYPRQWSWGQTRDLLAKGKPEITAVVGPHLGGSAALGFAFDTWLDQRDHGDHESNMLFGYAEGDYGDAGFVFLDYAVSMGMTGGPNAWGQNEFLLSREAPFPAMMLQHMDIGALEQAVKAIEGYPDTQLEGIVRRIPERFVQPGELDTVLAGLRARRAQLRELLSRYLPPVGGAA